ncbi:MAG: hypothetical protein HN404_23235 [Gemmatimonadetes bacterium]|jgi:hypothetical protein|nr:hypothetical protein [Gemmatimonadota bacterium]
MGRVKTAGALRAHNDSDNRDAPVTDARNLCIRRLGWLVLLLAISVLPGAAQPLSLAPVKWFDADNAHIPEPVETVENQVWDIADHTFFYQLGKPLDLRWTARSVGRLLRIAGPRQADNVNVLDEVPGSSWFANRHFHFALTPAQLAEGPGRAVPDTSGPWQIVAGKFEGGTAGFTVKDGVGVYFLLKFDSEGNKEMGSAAEVVATKILHAAGYNVPRNSIVYFRPSRLQIGPKATVPTSTGGKRRMELADVQAILNSIEPEPDGRLRCVASKFLSGAPVGFFNYDGRRPDDPNDRVEHQHRRELRGLRVLGAWLNDADRRAANTLDMYVSEDEGRRRYVKHYLIDMGSALGSNNLMPHMPKYGNEYVWDPRTIARSIVSLGLWRKPWEEPLPMSYRTIGYFETQTFEPHSWVPTYPNPAFEQMTMRDAYWGAKIVMSFSDEDLAAIVATGQYTEEPGAAAELTRLLSVRRDMIGRYYFGRVNPLDRFRVSRQDLAFSDLAVEFGLETAAGNQYQVQLLDADGKATGTPRLIDVTRLDVSDLPAGQFHGAELRTDRGGAEGWSKATRVFFYFHDDGRAQLVRIDRET